MTGPPAGTVSLRAGRSMEGDGNMIRYPASVTLCEVGLRDGLQNEKQLLTTQDKLELLRGLIAAGFPVIEVGSFMHPRAVP